MMKFSVTFLLFAFLFSVTVYSQQNDTTYLNYLLKNKNVATRSVNAGEAHNILKTDLITIFNGQLPIIWEHRFNRSLGFDAGIGILLPYTSFEILENIRADPNGFNVPIDYPNFFPLIVNPAFRNKKLGISLYAAPKIYFETNHRYEVLSHSNSLGIFYQLRSFSKLLINEVGITYAYILEDDVISSQPTVSLSYVMQTPYSDVQDVKYHGKASVDLTSRGLPSVNAIRLSFTFPLGYVFN